MVLRASLLCKMFLSFSFLVVTACSAFDEVCDRMPFICATDNDSGMNFNQTNETYPVAYNFFDSGAYARNKLLQEFTPLVLVNVFFGSVSATVGAVAAGDPKRTLKGIAYAAVAGIGCGISLSLGVDCHTRPLQTNVLHQLTVVGASALTGAMLGNVYS